MRSFFHIQAQDKKRLKIKLSLFYHTIPRRIKRIFARQNAKDKPRFSATGKIISDEAAL